MTVGRIFYELRPIYVISTPAERSGINLICVTSLKLDSPAFYPGYRRVEITFVTIGGRRSWWARLDLNQRPIGYEPIALTN